MTLHEQSEPGGRGELHFGRGVVGDLRQGLPNRIGIHRRFDGLMDQGCLVGKGPEDGALGDAGRLGHFGGSNRRALLDQQRNHGRQDRPLTILARERLGSTLLDVHLRQTN